MKITLPKNLNKVSLGSMIVTEDGVSFLVVMEKDSTFSALCLNSCVISVRTNSEKGSDVLQKIIEQGFKVVKVFNHDEIEVSII